MADAADPNDLITELIATTDKATDAWVRGDMDLYLALTPHAPGFTLMDPGGGPARRFEDRASTFEGWQSPFANGEGRLEEVETHTWGDTAVLVAIERQHGEVGDWPDQDLSLRVTHVYRREGSEWLLIHRHADPLVRRMGHEGIAALARGDHPHVSTAATEERPPGT